MTNYETLFIIHPDQGGRVKELIEKFKKIIESTGGTVRQIDEWGMRDLAYRIRKQSRGYYSLMQFYASPDSVVELERNLKLTEGVLRYLTVSSEPPTLQPGPRASSESGKIAEKTSVPPEGTP